MLHLAQQLFNVRMRACPPSAPSVTVRRRPTGCIPELEDLDSLEGLEQAAKYIADAIKYKKRDDVNIAWQMRVNKALEAKVWRWRAPIETWQWHSFTDICKLLGLPRTRAMHTKKDIAFWIQFHVSDTVIRDSPWACRLPPLWVRKQPVKAKPNTN